MSQNEPVENAIRQIDAYINEASSQPSTDSQPLSPSQRLQVWREKSDHSHRFLIFRTSNNLCRKFQCHYCRMSFEFR